MVRDAALGKKFRKLPNPMSPRNDNLVHNPSSKELTKDQMQVLRHEASFNMADAKPVNMISALESVLCQTEATEETKSLIRHQVSSLLTAHRPREVLSKVERDALRELKADKDLVIVPADKGRSTVVLDRKDYLQKAKGLLEDRQFYVPCATNPAKALTRAINATLLALENSGAITPTDRRTARPQDTALARFYGLPKVHKDGAPLRPIVSLRGTPTYGLAKSLFRRLKFLTAESDTTVSSSAQFLEKLKGERVSEDLSLFQGLLNNILEPTEAIEVSKAFRLGKRADNPSVSIRPRPLTVVLASSDQASLIYSRRFRIKGSNPETWLTQHVDDRELALPGYQMFRRDREGRQGGGVLTYVKNGLNVSDKTDNFSCSSEAIWLSIKVPSSPSLDVLTVYRPPRRDNMADARLLEELEKFATRPDILIMGDFNAPHIDWSSTHANSSEQTFDGSFLNTALNLFLTQHVMLPTRVREGQQANCLDLVLTKSEDSIDEVSCLPPLGKSDHVVLLWDYSLFSMPKKPVTVRRNLWRGDFDQMRADISRIEWESIFVGSILEDWQWFREILHELIVNHCPLSRKRLTNRPRWLTQALKNEVNKKRRLWKKSLSDRSPTSICAYKIQRNRVKGLILKTESEFERDLLNRAAENPKLFYGYIRQCTRNKDPIALLRTAEGEHLTDNRAKADHLSEFFRSVFSSETGFNPSALQSFEDTPIIETVQFTEGMVLTELLRLKESKSPGPDEIPAKILKELAGELSKPLSMLFHTSFETGYLPPDWKSAWITPLYKGGSRVSANNYRPVSLTSICCKIMEKIMKQQLMQFLEQNHLLSDSQHGFRKSRSCVTNLLYCLEHWTRAVDRGDMVHVIYIDFKKAFDSAPHHRLLYKLSRAGVRGKLLMWIQSFLIGRSQAVHVSDQQSAEVAVRSVVPQGSALGPTLFIAYVNDCANELNCGVAMFANDIKMWSTIRSEVDEARLQTNLDHREQWSKDWLLPFNVNKCDFLRVGRTSSPNHTVYRLTGEPLHKVDAQKDLGVWITTSLKPSLQCSKVAKSAMSILYLVKRAFSYFDEDCSAKVFQTFVRPHLEFAIQAWRPWTGKDVGILEKVQRRATKLVSGQWSLPYEARLANLALFPLSYRQVRGDLIQAFRIVRDQGCCLASGDFFELATTTNLRGHPLKLRVTGARLDTRKFFFTNRVVAAWNALPEDVVMSASVDTFKRRLDHHWSANHNNGSLPPP
ncbi:hypothetical protein SprV_0200551000 [Sparganum proliferum]